MISFAVVNHNTMNKRGFTLIELLLYIGVSSLLIMGIFSFTSLLLQSQAKYKAIMEVEEQGREIMHIISDDIRGSQVINFPDTQSSATSLILSGDNDIVFTLDSGVLYRSFNGATNTAMHNNNVKITNLSFQNLSLADTAGTLRIQFDLNYNNIENRPEYNYQQTFYTSTAVRP